MLPCQNPHYLLLFGICLPGCYVNLIYFIFAYSSSEILECDMSPKLPIIEHLGEVLAEITIGVGVAVAKVHCVVVIDELVLETECVKVSVLKLSSYGVSFIVNLLALPEPAYLSLFISDL